MVEYILSRVGYVVAIIGFAPPQDVVITIIELKFIARVAPTVLTARRHFYHSNAMEF